MRLPNPCPKTGRRLVYVWEWAKRPDALVDEYAYWFSPEADACGLDPWRLVEGVDAHIGAFDLFDVLFADGTYRTVEGRAGIYIRAKHYEVLQCALQSSRPGG